MTNKIVPKTGPAAGQYVGEALLNGVAFRFFAMDGEEGEADFPEKDYPYGEIHVGIGQEWGNVVGTLLHELNEACLLLLEVTFQKDTSVSNDRSTRLFLYDHAQHAEMCARVGDALAVVYDGYRSLWEKSSVKRYSQIRKTLDEVSTHRADKPKKKRKSK